MNHVVSIGLMEQKGFRTGQVADADETQKLLDEVTHIEYKYLDSIDVSTQVVGHFDRSKLSLLHVQYPAEGQGSFNLVDPGFREKLNGVGLDRIIEKFHPRWMSFHLGFGAEKLRTGGQFDHDVAESEPLPKDEIKRRILGNMEFVRDTYKGVGILLENLDYNPPDRSKGAYDHVTDPEFITEIVNAAGVGMLLDLSHAEISAKNMGYSKVRKYLDQLPLEKVVEMHLAKPGEKAGLPHDSHEELTDTELLEYLLLITGRLQNLRAITLETFSGLGRQLDLIKGAARKAQLTLLGDVIAPDYYFDLANFEHKGLFEGVKHVWEPIGQISAYIQKVLGGRFAQLKGSGGSPYLEEGAIIEPQVFIKGTVRVGKNSVIKSGTKIEGNAWIGNHTTIDSAAIYGNNLIGDHCEIRPGAYLRGNVLFGNHVEFRSEAKNVAILGGIGEVPAAAAHFSYLGDCIMGNAVNLGAGTKISNVKGDWTAIVLKVDGWEIPIGSYKLGGIIGDLSSTGCNSVVNPGTLMGKSTLIYPNTTTRGFIPSGYILKSSGEVARMESIRSDSLLGRAKLVNDILNGADR